MPDFTVEKSFCTTREAAGMLGVSIGTVQLWVESGLLKAWKTAGGHRRVLRDSIEQILRKTPQNEPELAQPPVAKRRLRVLVVEDDMSLLRLYQVQISRWPIAPEVTCMHSAVSALLAMGQCCPDLLITDLHMPGMDGFHMLRELRKSVETSKTTIVAVTGLDESDIALRGGLPAEVLIMQKPIPFDRLQAIGNDLHQAANLAALVPGGAVNPTWTI